ncbi:MAG: immunoglobulin domain-containing protein [Verrucomicrobia bacterium]|nr:immunoglobulin domain-containing protein [Verrucomicrobiota bacterium]
MKFHRTILPAAVAAMAVQMVSAQEITPKWYQHINGSFGVAEADKLPILKKAGQPGTINLNGTDLMDAYSQLIRYDATRLLLGIRENGINEGDANNSAETKALAAAYPDRSLIWLDAATGKPLGIAWKESLTPTSDIGIDVTAEGQGSQSNNNNAWWRVALDEGPEGQRALYSHFKHIVLRYAPKVGGGWETTPTVVYEEQVRGVGDGLSNGDGFNSWRYRDFKVRGSGVNTVIYVGGGTWRAGHHPQVLVTTDGMNFKPKGRVDNRDNGARRNDYALGGLSSFPVEYPNNYGGDSSQKISVVYAGHFPGTGWPARPNRYTSNPLNPFPTPAYNAQPDVALYVRNETAFGGLPAFNWEAAGKDGLPIDNAVDGVTRYDGNWNVGMETDPSLEYIVSFSSPSWNNQFPDVNGENVRKPGWLAIHRLDGSIASGNSALKMDFVENDEVYAPDTNTAETGHDYLYDPGIQVIPDTTAAANLDKSEVLIAMGSAGFGVFTVQNVGATIVSNPINQTVAAGTDVTITANVTGSPNDFQWYLDGQPLPAKSYYLGTTKKSTLKIPAVTTADAGTYQLKWTNPITGAGQTTEATLTVTGNAVRLTAAQIVPENPLPVTIPNGSVVATGENAFTVSGPGLIAFPSASNADQPGDVQEFAYESITGDFDISVKLTGLTSGPVTDPIDANAGAGLTARVSTAALSPSFNLNVSNPLGANQVLVNGRAIEGQNYTVFSRTYPGVVDVLPNQWLRIRRVGDYFAAYVGTNGTTWSLIGQRYQQWPATLLVGAYAFSASYITVDGTPTGGTNLATATFTNYGPTPITDTTAPTLVSVGTTDKATVGVKFSEPVASASAVLPINYKLSQGNVTAVRMGIGGDTVYLTVTGLTSDTFTVTVLGGVTDTAGNSIAANSMASGKWSNWASSDIGLIQDPAVRPTPGDDPGRVGQAVAVSSGDTETEVEIVGGGSNAWNPGDFLHYLNKPTPITGDFDVMVEVSRNDRPANTAGWANSGLMLRESVYLPGQDGTVDGTKVAMVANTTYLENSGPNRAAIPLWREEPGAGYGNGNAGFNWFNNEIDGIRGYYLDLNAVDAAGTKDPESSDLSARWLRIQRVGNIFSFYASYNGKVWEKYADDKELPLASNLLFGFSTMNDTGSNPPPGNAYAGNGMVGTDWEGNQNPSNYSVQRIRIGTNVSPRFPVVTPTISITTTPLGVVITYSGTLYSSDTLGGNYTPVAGATSPYPVPAGTTQKFFRAMN